MDTKLVPVIDERLRRQGFTQPCTQLAAVRQRAVCASMFRTISPEILRLLADTQFADDLAVPVCVTLLQIVKQASTLAHKHKQATA